MKNKKKRERTSLFSYNRSTDDGSDRFRQYRKNTKIRPSDTFHYNIILLRVRLFTLSARPTTTCPSRVASYRIIGTHGKRDNNNRAECGLKLAGHKNNTTVIIRRYTILYRQPGTGRPSGQRYICIIITRTKCI